MSDGHLDRRTAEARRRLGLGKGDMEGVPRATETILRGVGSVQAAIDALRGDSCPDSLAFIAKYDKISVSDRERLSLEEIFTAAGLTTRRFIEVVTGALVEQSLDIRKMMVAAAESKVIQATIKAATESLPILDADGEVRGWTNGDVKAMEIFHKATGFLPTPKGAQTTINLQQLNQSAQLADDGDAEPPKSMDEYLMELQDVLRPKELPQPAVETRPLNTPEIEYLEV